MTRLNPLRRLGLAALASALAVGLVYSVSRAHQHQVHGSLSSAGADWDTWSSTPMTCALDPQDGRPPAHTSTRLSLIWLDFDAGDQNRFLRWQTTPDQPLRLDLIAWPPPDTPLPTARQAGLTAMLTTVKHQAPLLLDAGVCTRLALETHPEAALVREGRPALAGTLDLDCTSAGRHLTGQIHFNGCGY